MENVIKNLKANNMETYFVKSSAEALSLVEGILTEGESVASGGSVTLAESGVLGLIKGGKYNYLDRHSAKTQRDSEDIFKEILFCDTYLTSANAITEAGELVNVDGNCNRISALAFGPKRVIVVTGKNKIVKDTAEGFLRVKKIAAPKNALRLGLDTPCAKLGHCVKVNGGMGEGCSNPSRMCVNYMVTGYQRNPDRIKVIIIDESLGY